MRSNTYPLRGTTSSTRRGRIYICFVGFGIACLYRALCPSEIIPLESTVTIIIHHAPPQGRPSVDINPLPPPPAKASDAHKVEARPPYIYIRWVVCRVDRVRTPAATTWRRRRVAPALSSIRDPRDGIASAGADTQECTRYLEGERT